MAGELELYKMGHGFVAQPAATADVAAITSLAAPAGGTGAAAGGWDTAGNRDLAITTINAIRTDLAAVRTQLNALLATLRTAGGIAT